MGIKNIKSYLKSVYKHFQLQLILYPISFVQPCEQVMKSFHTIFYCLHVLQQRKDACSFLHNLCNLNALKQEIPFIGCNMLYFCAPSQHILFAPCLLKVLSTIYMHTNVEYQIRSLLSFFVCVCVCACLCVLRLKQS